MEHRLEATRGDSGQTFDDWVRLTLNPVREHLGDIFSPDGNVGTRTFDQLPYCARLL